MPQARNRRHLRLILPILLRNCIKKNWKYIMNLLTRIRSMLSLLNIGPALPGPCVSISILSSVLADKNASLSVAAEAYCKIGIATSDALVSCYKTKYKYNQQRPITFIQANFNPTWKSLLPTPPFPDYTSAHSMQTGACCKSACRYFWGQHYFY